MGLVNKLGSGDVVCLLGRRRRCGSVVIF